MTKPNLKPKPKTFQCGVNSARGSFLAKLRWDFRRAEAASVLRYIPTLITWVREQNERDDSKKGGRGRKP